MYLSSSDEALLSGLARAGHSAVVWEEDMIVYGGYRFPVGDEEEAPGGVAVTRRTLLSCCDIALPPGGGRSLLLVLRLAGVCPSQGTDTQLWCIT